MGKLSVVLVIGAILTISLVSFIPDGGSEVLERLNEAGFYPKSRIISYQDSLQIRAMQIGDSNKPALLLIHGSPGDWSAWEHIIANDSVRNAFQIISIDRAGYGETTVPALENLDDQANIVWHAMTELSQTQNITIVGHSYGGAVVEQLLIDHPGAFVKAVLVAATLGPDLMAPRWYNKVANWSLVSKMISNDLRSSNIEMMGLPASLQLNEIKLKQLETPIIFIQGMEDILVPHETVDYFKEHKPTGVKYIIIEDMNHFTPWSDPHLITDAILGRGLNRVDN
jgi:pimeloyl-ACP methyl ester carboxylesterase